MKHQFTVYIDDCDQVGSELVKAASISAASYRQKFFSEILRVGFVAHRQGIREVSGELFVLQKHDLKSHSSKADSDVIHTKPSAPPPETKVVASIKEKSTDDAELSPLKRNLKKLSKG